MEMIQVCYQTAASLLCKIYGQLCFTSWKMGSQVIANLKMLSENSINPCKKSKLEQSPVTGVYGVAYI